ncbi:hypothetical protein PN36_04040 [Candidatus Thiomargarita nelsonii]|uniref:Uncharacterized protein n=1 Tax=Candidatus Thiomargarita nelsonii TaxID=1003181 RepID=A0A0A6PNC9_9GAMM|nr:hypothetical protein PN36_04040 [Candidatus Thiomargarita nelsonii]
MTNRQRPCDPASGDGPTSATDPRATCRIVTGTPVAVGTSANTIKCQGGRLVVQNNNSGPDRECTQRHEEQHKRDWETRYGPDLCVGVTNGHLPVGGDGYAEFLRQSECRAYQVGKSCRQTLLATASAADRPLIQRAIVRDDAQLGSNSCT